MSSPQFLQTIRQTFNQSLTPRSRKLLWFLPALVLVIGAMLARQRRAIKRSVNQSITQSRALKRANSLPSAPLLSHTLTAPLLTRKKRATIQASKKSLRRSRKPSSEQPTDRSIDLSNDQILTRTSTQSPSRAINQQSLKVLSESKFADCLTDENDLQVLFSLMERVTFEADQSLFDQSIDELTTPSNDRSDKRSISELGMWMVVSGKIGTFPPDAQCMLPAKQSINQTPTQSSHRAGHHSNYQTIDRSINLSSGSAMCEIGPGETICEWELISYQADQSSQSNSQSSNQPITRSFQAYALQKTELLFLSKKSFVSFIHGISRNQPLEQPAKKGDQSINQSNNQSINQSRVKFFYNFLTVNIARTWRIASFMLDDVIDLPVSNRADLQGPMEAAIVRFNRGAYRLADQSGNELSTKQSRKTPQTASASQSTSQSLSSKLNQPVNELLPGAELVELTPYCTLFEYGDRPDAMYLVDEGSLVCSNAQSINQSIDDPSISDSVAILPPGCICGALSLLGSTPRGELVRAGPNGAKLWKMTNQSINHLIGLSNQSINQSNDSSKTEPLNQSSNLLPILVAVGHQFAPILHQFASLGLDSRWYPAGSIIYRSINQSINQSTDEPIDQAVDLGDPADAVFMVISGRILALGNNQAGSHSHGQTASEIILSINQPINQSTEQTNQSASQSTNQSILFEVSRGELFGEDAPLGNDYSNNQLINQSNRTSNRSNNQSTNESVPRRTYTAVCVRDSEVVRLSLAAFLHIFSIDPRSMLKFNQSISSRLIDQLNNQSINQSINGMRILKGGPSIAIIALVEINRPPSGQSVNSSTSSQSLSQTHRPSNSLLQFVHLLIRLLEQHGPVALVTSRSIDHSINQSINQSITQTRARASRYLSELEEDHRFIVLLTDSLFDQSNNQPSHGRYQDDYPSFDRSNNQSNSPSSNQAISPWSRMAVEQADCVLLVAHETYDPQNESADRSSYMSNKTVTPMEADLLWTNDQPTNQSNNQSDSEDDEDDRCDVKLTRWKDMVVLHHPSVNQTVNQSSNQSEPFKTRYTRDWYIGRALRSHHHVRLDQSISLFANETNKQSINQSTNPSTNQSFTQSFKQSFHQSSKASSNNEPSQSHTTLSQPVDSSQPINQSVNNNGLADLNRLVRYFSNTSVGLVLSGGGARGLAHVGALRALEQAGCAIDMIGGCSQGAFVGCLYSMYPQISSIDQSNNPSNNQSLSQSTNPTIRAFNQTITDFSASFTTWRLLREFTLPLLSYFAGGGFSELIKDSLTADCEFEDLLIRFYCVSTNVTTGEMNVHRAGQSVNQSINQPLVDDHRNACWRYVRASMTLLGFLPPCIADNGDCLLDGGYSQNLPCEPMVGEAKRIIAVDVEDKSQSGFEGLAHLAKRADFGMNISGFWLAWVRVVGGVKLPDFSTILVWLACLNHARSLREAARQGWIDVYIRPAIEKYALMDYLKADEIIATGEVATVKAVKQWRHLMTGNPTDNQSIDPVINQSINELKNQAHVKEQVEDFVQRKENHQLGQSHTIRFERSVGSDVSDDEHSFNRSNDQSNNQSDEYESPMESPLSYHLSRAASEPTLHEWDEGLFSPTNKQSISQSNDQSPLVFKPSINQSINQSVMKPPPPFARNRSMTVLRTLSRRALGNESM